MKPTPNILYVDDEEINLEIFKINMHKYFKIETARSGVEGLRILEEGNTIQLVISDLRMPEMDGLEFIKTAKEKHPDIKFFIITGYEITPEIDEALETNLICQYFNKPYNVNEIISSVN